MNIFCYSFPIETIHLTTRIRTPLIAVTRSFSSEIRIYHSHNNTANLFLANLSWICTPQCCSIANQARCPVIICVVCKFPTSGVSVDHADAGTALLEFARYTNTTGSLLLLMELNERLLFDQNKYWSYKSHGTRIDPGLPTGRQIPSK